jgi:hypothetical protein
MKAIAEWSKRSLIFEPDGQKSWFVSHAALPIADHIADDCYRIYFSGRDDMGRAQIGYFDVDVTTPNDVLRISDAPVLGLGELGCFDDAGVTSSWIVNHRGRKYLYYSGWTRAVSIPFYFFIGLAISEDEGRSFRRISLAPILERNAVDPYLTGSPCVRIEGGTWRMWYVSGTGWAPAPGNPTHRYHIKYAESKDGIRWNRRGLVCIDYATADEYAIARPTVIKDGRTYRMWFCCRGDAYRLGYAESSDGIRWKRDDTLAGLARSPAGWDSEMIAYPFVFRHGNDLHLLYNGNGYGRTGIGSAVVSSRKVP